MRTVNENRDSTDDTRRDDGEAFDAATKPGWVVVDYDKPLYGKRFTCVELGKVRDALHGDPVSDDLEYTP